MSPEHSIAAATPVRERIVTELSTPPEASSLDRPWAGMTVQLHDWRAAGSVVSPAIDHDFVAMRYSGTVLLQQQRTGKVHRGLAVPGNVTIHPCGYESRWSWDRPGAIVIARIPQYVLVEAADGALKRTPRLELKNCFGARDVFVEPIMNLLAREIQQPAHPVQQLISESLSWALAGHLVQRFNVQRAPHSSDPAGINPHALRRVLDFMHAPSASVPTLTRLAQIAGVSRFHFARMFRRSTGDSPMAYLENLRLSRAQEMIRSGRYSLAQIAAAVGYSDQSHFTRRFRRKVGCTPAVYARHYVATTARKHQ